MIQLPFFTNSCQDEKSSHRFDASPPDSLFIQLSAPSLLVSFTVVCHDLKVPESVNFSCSFEGKTKDLGSVHFASPIGVKTPPRQRKTIVLARPSPPTSAVILRIDSVFPDFVRNPTLSACLLDIQIGGVPVSTPSAEAVAMVACSSLSVAPAASMSALLSSSAGALSSCSAQSASAILSARVDAIFSALGMPLTSAPSVAAAAASPSAGGRLASFPSSSPSGFPLSPSRSPPPAFSSESCLQFIDLVHSFALNAPLL